MFKESKKHKIQISKKDITTNSNFKNGSIILSNQQIRKISLNKLNEISGIPKKDEQIRIVTRKMINSFDFILAIIANNEIIENLIIAFYRISKKAIIEISELIKEGKIKNVILLINDGFPKLVPDAYNLLLQQKSTNFTIKLENNHTKIILIDTIKNKYIIEGSGNLSINARIEQYLFENNEQVFNFHSNWIKNI